MTIVAPATVPAAEAFVRAFSLLDFIRELPKRPNDGEGVRALQAATGNAPPDYWCASGVAYVARRLFGARWPLPFSASCDVLLRSARTQGILVEDGPPMLGDLFLKLAAPDDATHVGVVGCADRRGQLLLHHPGGGWYSADANAADPAKPASRNGNGLYTGRVRGGPTDRSRYAFVRWPSAMR